MRFVSNHFCLAEINYFGKATNLGHYFCCVGLSNPVMLVGRGSLCACAHLPFYSRSRGS